MLPCSRDRTYLLGSFSFSTSGTGKSVYVVKLISGDINWEQIGRGVRDVFPNSTVFLDKLSVSFTDVPPIKKIVDECVLEESLRQVAAVSIGNKTDLV